jgi:hypothetical protein
MKILPRLTICTRNPHLLQVDGGEPFLMLGDTAWELFHRLTLEEIGEYFEIRSSQGFNMVWANLLAEFDGLRMRNRNGHIPLEDYDPKRPSEPYFRFVAQVVDLAAQFGIYLGLLPAWGDKLTAPWGAGPAIFRLDNLDEAFSYAEWLGRRFADRTNILWVLGGDRPARLFGDEDRFPRANAKQAGLSLDSDWTPIWRRMAEGLRAGGANHLVTYHPQGGPCSTSVFLHEEPWLDMNAIQSGHGGGHDVPVWESVSRDYALTPLKPTFDAEPNYEGHPVDPWPVWDPATGFFDDYDVRKQIYRSIFSGGCGVIYGHHSVWQFASELYEPVLAVRMNWMRALRQPGAEQIRHLSRLFQQLDFAAMAPDQSILLSDVGAGPTHARAMRSPRESVVYVPDGREVILRADQAAGQDVIVSQYDPKTGKTVLIEVVKDTRSVTVPKAGSPSDRVIRLTFGFDVSPA